MRSDDADRSNFHFGPDRFGSALIVLLSVIAVAIRINNAVRFRAVRGFDALGNIEYVKYLMTTWSLPAPDAGWTTYHPPLFYYLSAVAARTLALFDAASSMTIVVPLIMSGLGLISAGVVYWLIRQTDPGQPGRAWLAAGLVAFLPAEIYMSAMFSSELLASALASGAIAGGCILIRRNLDPANHTSALRLAFIVGTLAGLCFLTKLSGALVVAAIGTAWAVAALRSRRIKVATPPIIVFLATATIVGGWFYIRSFVLYGYLYPQDLTVHSVMFEMPPGERGILDYLRFPLATFTDPQLLNPGLLRSVWGSTFATLWFDGHRHFLPATVEVSRMGSLILTLAIVPTAAFFSGALRGVRRLLDDPFAADGPLICLFGFTLVGYMLFTWGNPWFVTLKATYLLGAIVPFGFYTSEGLVAWSRAGRIPRYCVWGTLGLLWSLVALTFTIGLVFEKFDATGLPWRALS